MRKAAKSDVVFDLEDAVAPADKQCAREAVREVLDNVESGSKVCVRVNPIGISAAIDLKIVLEGTVEQRWR